MFYLLALIKTIIVIIIFSIIIFFGYNTIITWLLNLPALAIWQSITLAILFYLSLVVYQEDYHG